MTPNSEPVLSLNLKQLLEEMLHGEIAVLGVYCYNDILNVPNNYFGHTKIFLLVDLCASTLFDQKVRICAITLCINAFGFSWKVDSVIIQTDR